MEELDRPQTPPDFFRRLQIISAFFCALAVIFVLRLCTTAVLKGQEREQILTRLRVATTLKIPGCRGKILDRQGNILAWTERQMELVWHVPQNYSEAEYEWAELIRFHSFVPSLPHITRLTDYLGQDITLCSSQPFSTPEIWNAIQLISEHLECHATFKRCLSNPDLKQMIADDRRDRRQSRNQHRRRRFRAGTGIRPPAAGRPLRNPAAEQRLPRHPP